MESAARALPNSIKRSVRRRCGFGCVVCGLPIFEYDHIFGWANTHRHKDEEITLLCPNHHAEKTKGLLTVEQVQEADRTPWNLRAGHSRPFHLQFEGQSCEVRMPGLTFRADYARTGPWMIPILVHGWAPLAFVFDEGALLLNLSVQDLDGRAVLKITESELVYSTDLWDIEFVGARLRIREAARKFLLDLSFCPPAHVVLDKWSYAGYGVEIQVDAEGLTLSTPDGTLRFVNEGGQLIFDGAVGINVGPNPENLGVAFQA